MKSLGVMQLFQDEENTAVMRYFKKLFDGFKPFLSDIAFIKIYYSQDKCEPYWYLPGYSVSCMFNLYPKEWLVTEATKDSVLPYDLAALRSIEPWWKLVASNKGMLPLLYSMFPNHPSIIPAYMDNP